MTIAELEQCLAVAAFLVVRHGDAYVHTFERLEREVDELRQRAGKRDRAQQVLASIMKGGLKGAQAV